MKVLLIGVISFSSPLVYNLLNILYFQIFPASYRALPNLLTSLFGNLGGFVAVYVVEYLPGSLFLAFGAASLFLGFVILIIEAQLKDTKQKQA